MHSPAWSSRAASLRASLPDAEALITTAGGTLHRHSAVIAYNHFLHNIQVWVAEWMALRSKSPATIEKLYPGQRM